MCLENTILNPYFLYLTCIHSNIPIQLNLIPSGRFFTGFSKTRSNNSNYFLPLIYRVKSSKKSHRVTQKSSNVLFSYLSIPICLDASVWLSLKCAKVNAYISLQLNNPSFYTETHSHRTQIKT